jgi:hypothetical protein
MNADINNIYPDGWQIIFGDPIYKYAAHLKCWSRRLLIDVKYLRKDQWFDPFYRCPSGGVRKYLDFILEPIPDRIDSTWAAVGEIQLRFHDTYTSGGDKTIMTVPEDLQQSMLSHLDPEVVEFMLRGNVFNIIDWDVFCQQDVSSGVPIVHCQRG